jgi:hypothetical protein
VYVLGDARGVRWFCPSAHDYFGFEQFGPTFSPSVPGVHDLHNRDLVKFVAALHHLLECSKP